MLQDLFAAIAKTLVAQAAQSPSGTNLVWNEGLVEHFHEQLTKLRDRPLPLGSAVPAVDNLDGELLSLRAAPVQRAVLALLMLAHQDRLSMREAPSGHAADRVVASAGRDARQILGSLDDWLLRHPVSDDLKSRVGHVNRQFLQAVVRLTDGVLSDAGLDMKVRQTRQGGAKPVATDLDLYVANLVSRLNDQRQKDRKRVGHQAKGDEGASPDGHHPAPKPRYLCAFGPQDYLPEVLHPGPGHETDLPPPDLFELKAVKQYLDQPFGEWQLLALMYYKLVQCHLGHVRADGRSSGPHLALFPVVRAVVRAAAHPQATEHAPLAPYAAGIDRVLGLAFDPPWPLPRALPLPACFDRSRLDPQVFVLAQARSLMAAPQLGGLTEWADWVDRVGELAQETASQITSPLFAHAFDPVLNTQGVDHKVLQAHLDSWRRLRLKDQLRPRAPDDDFRTFQLRPRMARLHGYHGWMADEGLAAVDKAWASAASIFDDLAAAETGGEDNPLPVRQLRLAACLPTSAPGQPGVQPSHRAAAKPAGV